jgi:hypothetical protein
MHSLPAILHSFVTDQQVTLVAILIAADLIFGVSASLKLRTFNLSYIATFAKDDVLGKVVPWFGLFAFSKVAPGNLVAGIDFGNLATATFALVTAALVGSLVSSLADLGVPVPAIAAGHVGHNPPPPPAPPVPPSA